MKLSKLYLKDILTFIGIIIIGFGWVLIDQHLFSKVNQQFITIIVFILTLFCLQFFINKPSRNQVFSYANTIALITVSFIIKVSIMYIVIKHNFTYKFILIWIISALLPYIAGFIYNLKIRLNNLNARIN